MCHTIVIRRATETEGKRVNLIVCYTMAFQKDAKERKRDKERFYCLMHNNV